MRSVLDCSALAVLASASWEQVAAEEQQGAGTKPHIVFFMVDDWGCARSTPHPHPPTLTTATTTPRLTRCAAGADVGYHRAESGAAPREISSPNIDALVKQGVELDRHYVFKWCTPTRSSFLSGRLPAHVFQCNGQEVAPGKSRQFWCRLVTRNCLT